MFWIAKALIRIEKKQDETLKLLQEMWKQQRSTPIAPPIPPLNNPSQGACPVCMQPIMYVEAIIPETGTTIPIRQCGCEPQVVKV